MSKLTTHCLWSNLLFQTRFLLNLGKGCLPEGKMLSAKESMFTCLVTNVRTLLPSVLSKTSTSHTKHNFLKRRKEEEQKWRPLGCKYSQTSVCDHLWSGKQSPPIRHHRSKTSKCSIKFALWFPPLVNNYLQ